VTSNSGRNPVVSGYVEKYKIGGLKKNIERFPDDFMFTLSKSEFTNLRSQFATSSWGGSRHPIAYRLFPARLAFLETDRNVP
jgi:hypothetical protein